MFALALEPFGPYVLQTSALRQTEMLNTNFFTFSTPLMSPCLCMVSLCQYLKFKAHQSKLDFSPNSLWYMNGNYLVILVSVSIVHVETHRYSNCVLCILTLFLSLSLCAFLSFPLSLSCTFPHLFSDPNTMQKKSLQTSESDQFAHSLSKRSHYCMAHSYL